MVVYIEYLFLDNMAIDLLLLYLSEILLKDRSAVWRLFFAAGIGTVAAFLLPFIRYMVIPYKCAVAALMIAPLKHRSIKAYLKKLAVFSVLSFSLGGIIIGLFNITLSDPIGGIIVNTHIIPMTIFSSLLFYFFVRGVYITKKEMREKKYYHKAKLVVGDTVEELTGYYDSGNRLIDKNDNTPVAILSSDIAERLMEGGVETFCIEIDTVGGKSLLKAFKSKKLTIYSGAKTNIFENSTIAVAGKSFKNFNILLHKDML